MKFCKEIKAFDTEKFTIGFPYCIMIADRVYNGILTNMDELKLEFTAVEIEEEEEEEHEAVKLTLHYDNIDYYEIKSYVLDINS